MLYVKKILGTVFRILPWVIILAAIYLWHNGHIRPIADFLSQPEYTFQVGKTKITPYKILKTLFIFIMFVWLALRLTDLFASAVGKMKHINPSNRSLLIKSVSIVVYVVVALVALDVMGMDVTTLAVFSGAIGIGLGFGLQKIASNFISGIILLLEKSVEVDDLVDLGGGMTGYVRHTGARYTLLESFDGKEIMVPNEDFITSRVTNHTYSNKMGRMDLKIGVSYDSDIVKAREIILKIAKAHPVGSSSKPPECFIEEFGDSAVIILLFVWLDDVTDGRLTLRNDILISIWQEFKKENIEIPYPRIDINLSRRQLSNQ